jgi:hypothetical protein
MEIDERPPKTANFDSGLIDHPVFRSGTVILTEPINELYQMVRQLVFVRETGCCFTAHSGVGKTRALMMLEHLVRRRMPEVLVIPHNTWNHQVASIRAFYKHFLTAIGHPDLRGETFDLRHRLIPSSSFDSSVGGHGSRKQIASRTATDRRSKRNAHR